MHHATYNVCKSHIKFIGLILCFKTSRKGFKKGSKGEGNWSLKARFELGFSEHGRSEHELITDLNILPS